jgi:hypothetical protein
VSGLELPTSDGRSPQPWGVEVLGHTLRVIDGEGNDIVTLGNCRDAKNKADARLIAAAPDLLASLKDLVTTATNGISYELVPATVATAKQAIAKAEGL